MSDDGNRERDRAVAPSEPATVSAAGPCPECRGEGGFWIDGRFEPCEACDGTGEGPREDREGTT